MACMKIQFCDPCLSVQRDKDAVSYCKECTEALCEECQDFHKRSKSSRHHRLCELNDVPSQTTMDVIQTNMSCSEHRSEMIVYFCEDHDVFCCAKCGFSQHRKCDNVQPIEDIANNDAHTSNEEVKYKLDTFGHQIVEASRSVDKHSKLVAKYADQAEKQLKQVKKKLENACDILEWKIQSKVKERKHCLQKDLQKQRESMKAISKEVNQIKRNFETINKYGKPTDIHVFKHRFNNIACPDLECYVVDTMYCVEPRPFTVAEKVSITNIVEQIKDALEVLEPDELTDIDDEDPVQRHEDTPFRQRHMERKERLDERSGSPNMCTMENTPGKEPRPTPNQFSQDSLGDRRYLLGTVPAKPRDKTYPG